MGLSKMKTHSGSKKRFKVLASGKVKRKKANLRHLLTSKSKNRKRNLRHKVYVHSANSRAVRSLMVF